MTTFSNHSTNLNLLPNQESSTSGLLTEVSHRLVIAEEDIIGTMSRDYILVDLAEGDDVELGAHPSIYDEVFVLADNYAGNFALDDQQTADEAARDAHVMSRARQIEEEDDSVRELATTGDGV